MECPVADILPFRLGRERALMLAFSLLLKGDLKAAKELAEKVKKEKVNV